MEPSDRLAVKGKELDLDQKQQSDGREREGNKRHQAQEFCVEPFALHPTANQELHEKRVFDPHAKILARLAILREGARQSTLKALRRSGKKHEVQEHIEMEDDKNDWRENIKSLEG